MKIYFAAARGDLDAIKRELESGVPIDSVDTSAYHGMAMTPLMAAVCSDLAGVDIVKFLLAHGADPNAMTQPGKRSALHYVRDDREKLKLLLKAGADVRLSDSDGASVLGNACDPQTAELLLEAGADPRGSSKVASGVSFRGAFDVLRLLLDRGADIEPLKWTGLMKAVVLGTLDDVVSQMKQGADLTVRDHANRTPWLLSLCVGDVSKAKILLANGADKNEKGHCGKTSMEYAISPFYGALNHHEMVDWLISIGVDVNAVDDFGRTPLMAAAGVGDIFAAKALLKAGANLQAATHTKILPISSAANIAMVKILVEAGADINYVDGEGYCLLKRAASNGDIEMVMGLLTMGAKVETASTGDTALHMAVAMDDLEIMRILLDAGSDPGSRDVDWWTPLHKVRSVEAASLLLQRGARIDARTTIGQDPLQTQKDIAIQTFLIQSGAPVNPSDHKYGTPLSRAVSDNDLQRASFLLREGADPNTATGWGQTPLMEASEHSATELMRILIEAGADASAADEHGQTALFHAVAPEGFTSYLLMKKYQATDWSKSLSRTLPKETAERIATSVKNAPAVTYGYVESDSVEALRLLVKAGADINAQDNEGRTALIFAASCGRPARVRELLAFGADLEIRDKKNMSARDHGRTHPDEKQRKEILELLAMPKS